MNLAIDIGNTLTKCAIFEKNHIVKIYTYQKFGSEEASMIKKRFPIVGSVIVSSVVNLPVEFKTFFKDMEYVFLSHDTLLPIINLYKTPETLGKDRLAAIVGANYHFPSQNILVIDAGTCLKYDFINSKNEYIGGSISPGITMRYKSLNTFTDKLPLLEKNDCVGLIGGDTNESIWSGVQHGTLLEVKGVISMYSEKVNNLKVVLTGGDLIFFDKELKNSIFADPYLVLKGLNVILNHNISKKEQEY